ncbi:Nucleoside-diphosphate-sugar epimerase [Paenibacillus sp. CF095]|uniref:alpha/beta fold hydrolase n=1 Tax=Paenibacillus sp. CF095 TaxID=1881033 RepID=UPI00088D1A6B|nr:alpha/beta fold hydrolase [Paenibacillus sp. CF095]SDD75035.1 Nucleoside-diphosphate-sugar epimerase [Paenibacillus sp. CF095]
MIVHTNRVSNEVNTAANSTNMNQVIRKSDIAATTIFMTGSTGFIGKETVKQLTQGGVKLLLLVRSEQRARTVLKAYGVKDFDRITFITGDLSMSGLGLTPADRERALEANVIIHAGGTMDVTLERKVAEQIFMNGAREVAQLAQEIHRTHGLRHFIHVVGYMSPYGERNEQGNYLQVEHVDNNESAYEEMKFHADLHIREHAEQHHYPLSVINPSTVVGPRPTGETEQTGGIGLLIQAIQKGLMPVVPGGSSYWLPLVENDIVAQTLVFLSREAAPVGGTYPLLARKEDSPNMKELLQLLAQQLDVPKPKGAVPLPWIQWIMKSGGTRISGVPAESVAFITNRSFPVEETEALFTRMGQSWPDIREQLPLVTADLDYRLRYTPLPEGFPTDYTRSRSGDMAMLGWEGKGEPWIIVHGLLQSADEMLPLGKQLRDRTGNPVWLIDLAGFGRSPVHQGDEAFEGQVDALLTVLGEFEGPVKLVGHSIGAAIAAAAQMRSGRTDIRLGLLQPVANNSNPNVLRWLSHLPRGVMRSLLRGRSEKSWNQMFSSHSGVGDSSVMAHTMGKRIRSSLQSPRIAGAHADLLRWIHSGQRKGARSTLWAKMESQHYAKNALVVWANQDREYHYPQDMNSQVKRIDVPYGHYFPTFQYKETAAILAEWADTLR